MPHTAQRSNHRSIWRRTSIGRWSEVDEGNSGVSFGLRRCLAWLPFLVPMPRHSRRSQLSMKSMTATVFFKIASTNISYYVFAIPMKGVGSSPSPSSLRVHSRSAIADDHRYRRECPITCISLATDGSSFSELTRLNLQEPDL